MREVRPTSPTPEGSPIARRRRVEVLGEVRAQRGGAWESRLRRNVLYRQWRGFEQFAGASRRTCSNQRLGLTPVSARKRRVKVRSLQEACSASWATFRGRSS